MSNLDLIRSATCVEFNLPKEIILSNAKMESVAFPRYIGIWLCYTLTDHHVNDIAKAWDRTPDAVRYALYKAHEIMYRDPFYLMASKILTERLTKNFGLKSQRSA